MEERKTDGKCRVCGGEIVEKIVSKFDPMSGPAIIGPGSRQQFHNVSKGFHSRKCGIKYDFVPPAEEKWEKTIRK